MHSISQNDDIIKIDSYSHTDASGTIKGTVLCLVYAGSSADTTVATNKDGGSATKLSILDDAHVGSYVDVLVPSWFHFVSIFGSSL